MMRKTMMTAAATGFLLLAGCGGKGDDTLGEQVQEASENRADAMEEAADTMSGPAEDMMEANAAMTRAAGEAKEEAIDDADVDADAMSGAQKNAMINGQ